MVWIGAKVTSRMRSEGYSSRSVCLCVCVSVCMCLSVCLSVYDYSRATGYEAAYERYQQPQCYMGMKYNVGSLLKRLRSKEIQRENKRKSQYT